ncbi:MAG: hypothetical protein ITG02_13385 [Patulibacter sp.]|nr:hypothetical protein [Patulibacter sp.]
MTPPVDWLSVASDGAQAIGIIGVAAALYLSRKSVDVAKEHATIEKDSLYLGRVVESVPVVSVSSITVSWGSDRCVDHVAFTCTNVGRGVALNVAVSVRSDAEAQWQITPGFSDDLEVHELSSALESGSERSFKAVPPPQAFAIDKPDIIIGTKCMDMLRTNHTVSHGFRLFPSESRPADLSLVIERDPPL